jgi:hypothetical protein
MQDRPSMRRVLVAIALTACSGAPRDERGPDFELVSSPPAAPGSRDSEPTTTDDNDDGEEPKETPSPMSTSAPTAPPPEAPALLNGDFSAGLDGWKSSGDAFGFIKGSDGKPRLTTYVAPKGDGVVGKVWQDFTVRDTTNEIRFLLHGGDARVVLMHGNDVVQQVKGKRQNTPETEVVWNLTALRGETVRIMIDDTLTDPWGFVGAGLFELR